MIASCIKAQCHKGESRSRGTGYQRTPRDMARWRRVTLPLLTCLPLTLPDPGLGFTFRFHRFYSFGERGSDGRFSKPTFVFSYGFTVLHYNLKSAHCPARAVSACTYIITKLCCCWLACVLGLVPSRRAAPWHHSTHSRPHAPPRAPYLYTTRHGTDHCSIE